MSVAIKQWSLLDPELKRSLIANVYSELDSLNSEYPDFERWYRDTVIPDLYRGNRDIIFANSNDDICGISIIKHNENKICTLRVLPEFRNQGIGTELVNRTISILDTPYPVISVSSEHVLEFEKLFRKFGFKRYSNYNGYYKRGRIEYSYNGGIEPTPPYIHKKVVF